MFEQTKSTSSKNCAGMDVRPLAAQILCTVLNRQGNLSVALKSAIPFLKNNRDSALLNELCYGVTRWYPRLEKILEQLLHRNLKKQNYLDIYCLLLLGLYQLIFLRIAKHAVVNETVSAVHSLRKPWAKGLVNAILRRYQRDQLKINKKLETHSSYLYAHPEWMLNKIKYSWPHQWQMIVSANNDRAPLSLRVNRLKQDRNRYLTQCQNNHIDVRISHCSTDGIIFGTPTKVEDIPGFSEGIVSVQDGAAQLAAQLLDARAHHHILDACAAPGGKTCHILETQPNLASLIAIDIDNSRVQKIVENLQRLDLSATLITGDATTPIKWWNGQLFDRVLLDAPCSGFGVIRRHPDIKVLCQEKDIKQHVQLQQQLLYSLWRLVKPGGKLLYTTCSILPEENEIQITRFLNDHVDALPLFIDASWGRPVSVGKQNFPNEQEMDGFYYALIQKKIVTRC